MVIWKRIQSTKVLSMLEFYFKHQVNEIPFWIRSSIGAQQMPICKLFLIRLLSGRVNIVILSLILISFSQVWFVRLNAVFGTCDMSILKGSWKRHQCYTFLHWNTAQKPLLTISRLVNNSCSFEAYIYSCMKKAL